MIGDRGFAGRDFERDMTELGITFIRPDRRNETRRHGNLATACRTGTARERLG